MFFATDIWPHAQILWGFKKKPGVLGLGYFRVYLLRCLNTPDNKVVRRARAGEEGEWLLSIASEFSLGKGEKSGLWIYDNEGRAKLCSPNEKRWAGGRVSASGKQGRGMGGGPNLFPNSFLSSGEHQARKVIARFLHFFLEFWFRAPCGNSLFHQKVIPRSYEASMSSSFHPTHLLR